MAVTLSWFDVIIVNRDRKRHGQMPLLSCLVRGRSFVLVGVCTALLAFHVMGSNSGETLVHKYDAIRCAKPHAFEMKTRTEYFVGVISTSGISRYDELRDLHRHTIPRWAESTLVHKFFVSSDSSNSHKLCTQNSDVVCLNVPTGYHALLQKTFGAMRYAFQKYNFNFFLKVDDDTFSNYTQVTAALGNLRHKCPSCHYYVGDTRIGGIATVNSNEKYYVGTYLKYTGVPQLLPFNAGPAYILSHSLVKYLVHTCERVGLYFSRLEDVTIGLWLLPLNVTLVPWWGHYCIVPRPSCTQSYFVHTNGSPSLFFAFLRKQVYQVCNVTKDEC